MHWFQSFLLMPLLTQNSLPSTCHHALCRRKLLITPDSILSKICFPQQRKGVEETIICFKFSQKIWRWLRALGFLYLSQFEIFPNVMALQFCKYYLSYIMVLTLLLLLRNNVNFILKLHQKKIASLMKGGFYRQFKSWKCTRDDK